ncbi:MAG: ABC transporter permease [Oleibacter sp.]|nr:ABC transporter permease [Thalassolituus sp.]
MTFGNLFSSLSFRPYLLWSDILIFVLLAVLLAFVVSILRDPLARMRWRQVFISKIGASSFIVILFFLSIAVLDSLHFQEKLERFVIPVSSPAVVNSDVNTDANDVASAGSNNADNTPEQDAEQAITKDGEEAPTASSETSPIVSGEVTNDHYAPKIRSVLDLVLSSMQGKHEKTYSAPFAIYSFAKENQQQADGTVLREFPRLKYSGAHLQYEEDHFSDVIVRSISIMGWTLIPCLLLIWFHYRVIRNPKSLLPWPVIYTTLTVLAVISAWALIMSEYYHVLGTDKVGQSVLYQSVKAVRTGVLIGTLATLITLPLAIILGISAGYFKGWVDDVVQYIYTTLNSIPGILLVAASVLLIDVYIETHPEKFSLISERADFKFLALCFILGMTSWTGLCRLLRAETLKLSQLEYVEAARAFGVSGQRIIWRHILPNTAHIILITLVLDFSGFVLAEAVLSYIGVGVDPSMASWGNMINEARAELAREPVVWWSVSAAFVLMFSLVLAANLFSDRVRDAFDPRMGGSGNDEPDSSEPDSISPSSLVSKNNSSPEENTHTSVNPLINTPNNKGANK